MIFPTLYSNLTTSPHPHNACIHGEFTFSSVSDNWSHAMLYSTFTPAPIPDYCLGQNFVYQEVR